MTSFFHSLKFVILLFAGIFVAWAVAMLNEWFFFKWWVDVILHFAGGFWVAVLGQYIFGHYQIEISGTDKNFIKFVVFVSFVSFVGVLWEFFEFVMDRYIVFTRFTYLFGVFEDTLLDLLMDILGGAIAFLLYFKNGKA